MEQKKVEKVSRVNWKDTIRQIERGEMAEFEILAEEVTRVRFAACELNRETGASYSIRIAGNMLTVKYE
jgi:hypothetical protein